MSLFHFFVFFLSIGFPFLNDLFIIVIFFSCHRQPLLRFLTFNCFLYFSQFFFHFFIFCISLRLFLSLSVFMFIVLPFFLQFLLLDFISCYFHYLIHHTSFTAFFFYMTSFTFSLLFVFLCFILFSSSFFLSHFLSYFSSC